MDRAIHLVKFQSAVGVSALAGGNGEAILDLDCADAEDLAVAYDLTFNGGLEIILCGDSARFQRAGQGAGQSTSQRRQQVIHRGRQLL